MCSAPHCSMVSSLMMPSSQSSSMAFWAKKRATKSLNSLSSASEQCCSGHSSVPVVLIGYTTCSVLFSINNVIKQSFERIANPDIPCGRIANPPERRGLRLRPVLTPTPLARLCRLARPRTWGGQGGFVSQPALP